MDIQRLFISRLPRRHTAMLLAGALFIASNPHFAAADEPPNKTPLQRAIDDSLEWFTFTGGPDQQTLLKAVPVLRWNNPTRDGDSGLTVLFVGGGRPEAVVCIYPWNGKLIHEFSSLSRGKFTAQLHGDTFWSPEDPGVTFAPIPESAPPADTPVERLRQMRMLFRRFESTMLGWRADKSDRQELRALPRPLYRYGKAEGNVIDGAVFAYVMGTDPETLLLIEAIQSADGPRWEYAFARRTSGALEGRLDGRQVWNAGGFPQNKNPQGVNRSMGTPLEDVLKSDDKSEGGRPAPHNEVSSRGT